MPTMIAPRNVVASLIIIAFSAMTFINFLAAGRDDTFIMLWAGQTFSLSDGFVNYNLEPQEVASSELAAWIAAVTRGWPPAFALLYTKSMGLLAGISTLWLTWKSGSLLCRGREHTLAAYLPLLGTAASQSFQYWTVGGLETPYYTGLLLAFALLLAEGLKSKWTIKQGTRWTFIAVLVLLMITRTEGFWPWMLTVGLICLQSRTLSKLYSSLSLLVIPGIALACLFLFRYSFTHQLWPNPVYAKVGISLDTLTSGLAYVRDYFTASPWCLVQALGLLYGAYELIRFLARKGDNKEHGTCISGAFGAVALCHLAFVILNGGNWMEYSRFVTPAIPILNILVMLALIAAKRPSRVAERVPKYKEVTCLLTLAGSLTQQSLWINHDIKNCSSPLPLGDLFSLTHIAEHTLKGNCAHGRDLAQLKPFIDDDLPMIVEASPKPLIVASYQAGFFPYFLRRKFTPDEVRFIDTVGLTDVVVAKMPGTKTTRGLLAGGRVDLALRGEAGALSDYLRGSPPTVIYLLGADQEMRDNLTKLGYFIRWEQPGAIVFHKPEKPMDQ